MLYLVMTRQTDEDGESIDVCESRRTDLKAAKEDVELLRWAASRTAWIVERK